MLKRHYDIKYSDFHPTTEAEDSSHTMAGFGNIYDEEPLKPKVVPIIPVTPAKNNTTPAKNSTVPVTPTKNTTTPVTPAKNTTTPVTPAKNTTVPVVPVIPANTTNSTVVPAKNNTDPVIPASNGSLPLKPLPKVNPLPPPKHHSKNFMPNEKIAGSGVEPNAAKI